MSSAGSVVWEATVSLPASTTFEYKYIRKTSNGTVVWESGANRYYTTPSGGSVSLSDTWH
ncbi:hypothetical protein FRC12_008958 [Ceratobasidium sp. 428]|nr:hypothetical protein FRC12_008958 [Ceratobasidium sp. 428]